MSRQALGDVGLALLAVAVGVGSVATLSGLTLRGASPDELVEQPALRVLAVADQLATPSATSTVRTALSLAADELRWELTTVPAVDVGYTAAPNGGPNIAELVDTAAGAAPYDAVVVQAGAADVGSSIGSIGLGVKKTIDNLRAELPLSTRIVLVGPVGGDEEAFPNVRAALDAVAARERVHYLDPIEQGWLPDEDAVAAELDAPQQRQAGRRLVEAMRQLRLSR